MSTRKNAKKNVGSAKNKAILVLSIIVILLIIALIFTVHSYEQRINLLSGIDTSEDGTSQIDGIPLKQDFIPEGYAGRPQITREIKYIVIHETANENPGANALAHEEYLLDEAKEEQLSWHYTVDDSMIVQHLPDGEVGWHAGDSLKEPGGNMNGIGIEICVNEDGDFNKSLDNAARLTAYLLNKYDLSIDAVKQHHDFSQKNCPLHIREEGLWDAFLSEVSSYL